MKCLHKYKNVYTKFKNNLSHRLYYVGLYTYMVTIFNIKEGNDKIQYLESGESAERSTAHN